MIKRILILSCFSIFLITCFQQAVELQITQLDPTEAAELAKQIREEAVVEIADGFELSLWASDSLLADPIALDMDDYGRVFVTRTQRQRNSEFDIRGHMDWATRSVSWQTVEDRRAFLHKEFDESRQAENDFLPDLNKDSIVDWKDLTVQTDQVIRIEDRSGNGVADFSQIVVDDFNEEITDCMGGILVREDDMFVAISPDLWRLKDTNGDGQMDEKTSIAHGFGIHVGFGAHGMSGVRQGPDGKIYWGIGDVGANITDKSGKQWKFPNQGVIVRANPDGSDFEVFARGLRNTHEFVFDDYGNIITEDNDGDHPGESERLAYIVYGSDTGWRINWQFGKYTDDKNNDYKVWMDENMYKPRHDGQAAYFLPPIMNYHNGPTGMLYNPGTALNDKWKNTFFIVEFVGNPARSAIHSFKLKPEGAGFVLDKEQKIISGVLPTGMDFGPDGALYFSDWINGWGTKNYGRVWKLDVTDGINAEQRATTKKYLQSNYKEKTEAELEELLAYPDQRIRLKAQFELVNRGEKGAAIFLSALRQTTHQLARVHAIWGTAQLARQDANYAVPLVEYINDEDVEIGAQVVKWLGDIRYKEAGSEMIAALQHPSPRVRFFAAEALGRIEYDAATQPLIKMLATNDDKDVYLRHAGSLALASIGNENAILGLAENPSRSLRTAAVMALRRMQSPKITTFLSDKDEYIVAEAARAINDDWSIESALPELAKLVREKRFTSEPLLRRAINACSRVGTPETLAALTELILRKSAPEAMRVEALATLAVWDNPSVLDRVDGRFRGEVKRDKAIVKEIASPLLPRLFSESNEKVVVAAIETAGKLELKSTGSTLLKLMTQSRFSKVRVAALNTLGDLKDDNLAKAIQSALKNRDADLRLMALGLVPKLEVAAAEKVDLLSIVFDRKSVEDQQVAIQALAELPLENTKPLLQRLTNRLRDGKLLPEVQLDLEETLSQVKANDLLDQLPHLAEANNHEPTWESYTVALKGGDAKNGENIFYRNAAAQCVRCHVIGDWGGAVGPDLTAVGNELTREELLQSLVEPSMRIAPGFGVVSLTLNDDSKVAGIVKEEKGGYILLENGEEKHKVKAADVKERSMLPSSMLSQVGILTKRQIRDVVEFLTTLKPENS